MTNAINADTSSAPWRYEPSSLDTEQLAEQLLLPGSVFRDLERRGDQLNLDGSGVKEQLTAALSLALNGFKASHRIQGDLSANEYDQFAAQFVKVAANKLDRDSSLATDIPGWFAQVVNYFDASDSHSPRVTYPKDRVPFDPGPASASLLASAPPGPSVAYNAPVNSDYSDTISETGGRKVLDVYENKFNELTKARNDKQEELREKTDLSKYLANSKAAVTAGIKAAADNDWDDSDKNCKEELMIQLPYKDSKGKIVRNENGEVLTKKSHIYEFLEDFYPDAYAKTPNRSDGKLSKNDLDRIQSQLDALTKSENDEAQIMTTDLQDINSQYNNITEAISKFIQKMYETSKAFIR